MIRPVSLVLLLHIQLLPNPLGPQPSLPNDPPQNHHRHHLGPRARIFPKSSVMSWDTTRATLMPFTTVARHKTRLSRAVQPSADPSPAVKASPLDQASASCIRQPSIRMLIWTVQARIIFMTLGALQQSRRRHQHPRRQEAPGQARCR